MSRYTIWLTAVLLAMAAFAAFSGEAHAREWGEWKTFHGVEVQVARYHSGAVCHVRREGTFHLSNKRATARDCARRAARMSAPERPKQPRPTAEPKQTERPHVAPGNPAPTSEQDPEITSPQDAQETESGCLRVGGVWVDGYERSDGVSVRGYCRSTPGG